MKIALPILAQRRYADQSHDGYCPHISCIIACHMRRADAMTRLTSAIRAREEQCYVNQRVMVNVVLSVTVCPADLAETVAVAVPAQPVCTFQRQV